MRFHHETAAKIRQCCVYIKDDAKIAAYVSSSCEPVAANDVRRIRESMPAYYAPCSGRYTPGAMAINQEPVGLERESRHREDAARSEEHTSELQSLMRISYAGFCLKKNKNTHTRPYPRIPDAVLIK